MAGNAMTLTVISLNQRWYYPRPHVPNWWKRKYLDLFWLFTFTRIPSLRRQYERFRLCLFCLRLWMSQLIEMTLQYSWICAIVPHLTAWLGQCTKTKRFWNCKLINFCFSIQTTPTALPTTATPSTQPQENCEMRQEISTLTTNVPAQLLVNNHLEEQELLEQTTRFQTIIILPPKSSLRFDLN